MKALRLSLAYLLIIPMLTLPVWGESDAVGSVVSSQFARFATARDSSLTPGSTVFSGDSIVVADKGDARIAFAPGDQLDVFGDSGVQVARERAAVDFAVDRGSAVFRTGPSSSLQGLLGDAVIRGLNGPSVGMIVMESEDSAVVFAREGKLSIRTEHDGKNFVLNEGDAARVTLVALPPQTPTAQTTTVTPGGKGPFLTPKRLAIIALVIGGGLLAGLLVAGLHEHKVPVQVLINEITPAHPR